MPAVNNYNTTLGVPRTRGMHAGMQFQEVIPYFEERNLAISGITKDSTGSVLASCVVKLYDAQTDIESNSTLSGASGNFFLEIPKSLNQPQTTTWYLIAYKSGGTPVVGSTINTLVGS